MSTTTRIYLGAQPSWIGRPDLAGIPLFISANRLRTCKTIRRATGPVAIDSGGFSELKDHGQWRTTPAEYAAEIRRYVHAIGPEHVVFVAQQDWMCEDIVINGGRTKDGLFAGTGLSVAEHQRLTVENFIELRRIAPDIPWMPVIQGQTIGDYLECIHLFTAAGVDLRAEPIVGIGSVCRRQGTAEIDAIVSVIASMGIALHGFGVKAAGIEQYGPLLASADSMAWSYAARRRGVTRDGAPVPCGHGVTVWQQNCPGCAAAWWRDVSGRAGRAYAQGGLDLFG